MYIIFKYIYPSKHCNMSRNVWLLGNRDIKHTRSPLSPAGPSGPLSPGRPFNKKEINKLERKLSNLE